MNTSKNSSQINNSLIIATTLLHLAIENNVSTIHFEMREKLTLYLRQNWEQATNHSISTITAYEDYIALCKQFCNFFNNSIDKNGEINSYHIGNRIYNLNSKEYKLRYNCTPVYPKGFDIIVTILPIT